MRALAITLFALTGCIVIHDDDRHDHDYDYCDWSDDCAADEVCNAGVCDYAFDLEYEVVITSTTVGATHPDGGDWDPDGGLPDLFVSFGLVEDFCVTTTVADSLSADWSDEGTVDGQSCVFFVGLGDVLVLEVYDEDSEGEELGASWALDSEEAMLDVLRSDGMDLVELDESDTISLSYYVLPY